MQQQNETSSALNRDAFFASGASINHGNHVHEFVIHEDHAHALTIQNVAESDDIALVSVEDMQMSKEEAFSLYTLLMNPPDNSNMLNMIVDMMNSLIEMSISNENGDSSSDTEEDDLDLNSLFKP